MLTQKQIFTLGLAGLLALLALGGWPAGAGSRAPVSAQTWPTRTPTPDPNAPTATAVAPTSTPLPPPPPTNPPPQATAVPPPATATSVATVAPGSTPSPQSTAAALLLTAVPCGQPPTIRVQARVNVRHGPGADYTTLATLAPGEVRLISGRAANAEWWLIELADRSEGWVANQLVTVSGYTGQVPLKAAPAINNVTPTPGPAWNPTPNPLCTPMPTATTAATATATVTVTPGSQGAGSGQAEATAPATLPATTAELSPTVTATPQATATVTAPATAAASPMPGAAPTAVPLPSAGNDLGSGWILYLGIGLILLGAMVFIAWGRGLGN